MEQGIWESDIFQECARISETQNSRDILNLPQIARSMEAIFLFLNKKKLHQTGMCY